MRVCNAVRTASPAPARRGFFHSFHIKWMHMALFYAIMLYYAAEPQIRKEVFSWTTP